MKIYPFYSGSMASNSYVLTDDTGEHAVVIDPSQGYKRILHTLPKMPQFSAILLTHAHFDHILTLDEWRKNTGAPVYVGRGDAAALPSSEQNLYAVFYGRHVPVLPAEHTLGEGDTIAVGSEKLRVLELPGHTPGGLAFCSDDAIFTGDTLFADGGYGRTDFPGGDAQRLALSIRKLFTLQKDLTVYPGHGPATTLEKEAAYHGFLL